MSKKKDNHYWRKKAISRVLGDFDDRYDDIMKEDLDKLHIFRDVYWSVAGIAQNEHDRIKLTHQVIATMPQEEFDKIKLLAVLSNE